jgi:hypothetical protein
MWRAPPQQTPIEGKGTSLVDHGAAGRGRCTLRSHREGSLLVDAQLVRSLLLRSLA